MRILVVTESGWTDDHFAGSLREDKHHVDVFHYGSGVGEYYPRSARKQLGQRNAALLDRARQLKSGDGLDLIFCYVYDDFLLPETAHALQRLDVPLVNYNVDMINQWYRQTRTAKYFTRMLCAQRNNMHLLARYNPNVRYFPMAARWSLLSGDATIVPPTRVAFVGTPTPYRARILSEIIRAGVPCDIFGKFWLEERVAERAKGVEKLVTDAWHYTWPKARAEGVAGLVRAAKRRLPKRPTHVASVPKSVLRGVLPQASMGPLFRAADVNLGFNRTGEVGKEKAPTQLKLRDFEVPVAGGFYLAEQVDEYAEHFRIGEEVETWRTPDELAEKARYYLEHSERRQAMARAAHERALRDHTWSRRFSDLFADLGLRA